MTTLHLTEDDLVLHYYGELDTASENHAATHLSGCDECHRAYARLQRVLAAVESVPAPALSDGFERTVWARLEPALPASRGWLRWLVFSPANLAWVSAILVLIAGAFYAGRVTRPAPSVSGSKIASSEQIREGVLLVDLGEHLDRSQTMLVELVSAEPDDATARVAIERARAGELVAANRLYRQAATQTGDVAVSELLDELERLLVELSASPDQLPTEDMERVKQQIAAKDLLFKVRVVSSGVRERQKQHSRTRTGAGQSS
ncbi:MAG: hypothetical protein H0W08_26760 [Acidobacteria bacterium]|nr:hypothetical protein [Acidobacteriota bacterium]